MPSYDELINELSDLCGIVPEYWDIFGTKHTASTDTKKAILREMRLSIDTAEEVSARIKERRNRPWNTFVESVRVLSVNAPPLTIPVYLPLEEGEVEKLSVSCVVEDEEGQRDKYTLTGDRLAISGQHWIDGARYVKVDITEKKKREIGYYSATVSCRHPRKIFPGGKTSFRKTATLIVTPDAAYTPEPLEGSKTWGLSVNLYSVRSSRNWGIGDFTDLKTLLDWIAAIGGGFVGINPLHATQNKKPFGISPYSPISRLYKNFLYLDIERVPEVTSSRVIQEMIHAVDFSRQSCSLSEQDFIDYEGTASAKERILRSAFNVFYADHYKKATRRALEFRDYVSREGRLLDSFSLFCALREHLSASHDSATWKDWPKEYTSPTNAQVREFKKNNSYDLLYYKYVQWLIDEQLKEATRKAVESGMPVGLYHDLAIGSVGGGSDAWTFQDVIAFGTGVGAPPDDFNLDGQNWGFPALIPERLRETAYELFVQTLRKNMKFCGAIRIDHALGLFRLFWIPRGTPAKNGAYVEYPSEDLLRIIALESVRNKTMIIAEDLGTVGENVRGTLQRFHMLSYRLLYFERKYPDPSFLPPDRYPPLALCAVTTHDLPTLYGYWTGHDLAVKRQLGMYRDDAIWQKHVQERERDRGLLLDVLKSQGIVSRDQSAIPDMTPELCLAIHEYLARTPCMLVAVTLDDLQGTLDQQNMPGVTDSYPSWMRKTSCTLENMLLDKNCAALSMMFKKNQR